MYKKIRHRALTSLLLASTGLPLAAVAFNSTAYAQGSDVPGKGHPKRQTGVGATGSLETIVVTAEKRSQKINRTPLAITALGSATLTQRRVQSMADLIAVSPGVRSSQQQGVNRLFIRGIGLNSFAVGADPSVAFYDDGLYIGRPAEQLTSFFDLSRVEILRGPQATLYGRNATGGTINLITNQPTDTLTAYLNSTVGNYGLYQFEGAVSGPLIKDGILDGRVAFQTSDHDGYGRNLFLDNDIDNEHKQSVRVNLRAKPVDWFTDDLVLLYSHQDDRDYTTAQFGAYPGYTLYGVAQGFPALGDSRDQYSDDPLTNRRLTRGLTNTATVELNNQFELKSITGYRNFQRINNTDADGTADALLPAAYAETSRQVSQSFQLNYTSKKLIVVSGLDYYHEKIGNNTYVPFPQFGPTFLYNQFGTMDVNSYDAYAQGTYTIIPRLRLVAGGRYTVEKRSTDGSFRLGGPTAITPTSGEKTWYSFTPKGDIDFDVAKDVLAYGSVTTGFKSGTFDIGQINPPINPEKVTAYEVGVKASEFNHRLDLTFAAFYYDFRNLQVNKIIGISTTTLNAASATNKGLEFSALTRPIRNLTLNADVSYVEAQFVSFTSTSPIVGVGDLDLAGKQLPGPPKWTVNIGAEYTVPLPSGADVTSRVDANYRSKVFFSEFNDPFLSQGGVFKFDASTRYDSASGLWNVSLWGKNITNQKVASNKTLGVLLEGYPVYGSWEPPATFGATLGLKY